MYLFCDHKLATTIVNKRHLIFLLLAIGLVFSFFSTNWIQVEDALLEFLPEDSESRQGLDVMEEEFTTYGTVQVMLDNLSLDQAKTFYDELCDMLFACEQIESGIVEMEPEQMELLDQAKVQMEAAKAQLQGKKYNRVLV